MSLKNYLQTRFVDKPTFASMIGVSTERLDQLIAVGAIPDATYFCDGNSVRSAAFGIIEAPESPEGEYFRPECARWALMTHQAATGEEREIVLGNLAAELRAALQELGEASGAIESKIQKYLPHFWSGTFGLCVADPSTGAGIVKKEILQEKLSELTDNGKNPFPAEITQAGLLQLIDDYANSAMPFSPIEYPRSSRKRLVDDLRPVVVKAQQIAAADRHPATRSAGG